MRGLLNDLRGEEGASIKDHAGEVDSVIEKRVCGPLRNLLEGMAFKKGKTCVFPEA